MLIFDMKGVAAEMQARAADAAAQAAVADAENALKNAKAIQAAAPSQADKDSRNADIATRQATFTGATDAANMKRHIQNRVGSLYWMEANAKDSGLTPLDKSSLLSRVYTTEKVLVLICNAAFNDTSDMSETSVVVNGPDIGTPQNTKQNAAFVSEDGATFDRLYVLDPSKATGNSLTRVNITFKTASTPDTLATVLIERHKIIHYSAGGGLLVTRATQTNFSAISVPTVVTTTTTNTSTAVTNGVTTGTMTSGVTTTAAGTASYVLSQRGSNLQVNSVAGVTLYPFGRDTYPITGRKGFANVYGLREPLGSLGIFLGTSVNTLGNFTVAPSFEPIPGLQVFAGASWWSKNILQSGITPCIGYGTSPSFTSAPTTTSTSTSTTPPTTTSTITTQAISTATTSGCSNGDKATLFTGTTVPMQTVYKPAFAFGVLLNSNLIKAFSSLTR